MDRMKKTGNKAVQPLSLKANMLWNSIGSLIYLACQWLLTIVVVRISGDFVAAGVLYLAMSVFNIFQPIAVYRMYTFQISDVKHEYTLGEYFTFKFVTAGIAFIACIVYTITTCSPSSVAAVLLFTLYRLLSVFIDVLHAADQVYGRMDYIGISWALQGIGSLIIFVAVFATTNSLELAFIGMIILTIAVGVFYDYPCARQFEPVKMGISGATIKHLLLLCLPLVIATVLCAAAASAPRQYLAFSHGETLLGAYASVAAPAAIIQMGASYIYNPLLSRFSENFVDGDMHAFYSLLKKTLLAITALGVAASILLALIGPWLLELLFGNRIAEYSYLLVPVIVCTFITGFLWFLMDLLICVREFKGVLWGNIIGLLVVLVTTVPLVAFFDANGISFAVTIGYLAGAIIMGFALKKSLPET